jgi:hypothetical protein
MPLTKKTIVLDLDHTFITTQHDMPKDSQLFQSICSNVSLYAVRTRLYKLKLLDMADDNSIKLGLGTERVMWGLMRNHSYEFLAFCQEYFDKIIVWSAGRKLYVHQLVDILFKDLNMPFAILTYDDMLDSNGKYDCVKRLSKISKTYNIPLEQIIIIDDNEDTFTENPNNAIHIPVYFKKLNTENITEDETSFLTIKDWLMREEVINCSDFALIKKPF